jgi:hypothetical protein
MASFQPPFPDRTVQDDHVLRPLVAPGRPNAPPELAALATLNQITAGHIARARVPTAA